MNELAKHYPTAHETLSTIDDEATRHRIAQALGMLSHQDLYTEQKVYGEDLDDGWGPSETAVYERPDPALHTPEQQAVHGEIEPIVDRAALYLQDAHKQLKEKSAQSLDGNLEFEFAAQLALRDALRAHSEEDAIEEKAAVEAIIAVMLIGDNSYATDVSLLNELVSSGAANTLINVLSEMKGVVTLSDSTSSIPKSVLNENRHAIPLLEFATGKVLDDEFQVKGLLTDVDPADVEAEREELSHQELLALMRLEQPADTHKALEYATYLCTSVAKQKKEVWREVRLINPTDLSTAITMGIGCMDKVGPNGTGEFSAALSRLSSLRLEDEKAPSHDSSQGIKGLLNSTLLELAKNGHKEAVMALISSSPHDSALNRNNTFGAETGTESADSQAYQLLDACNRQKRELLIFALRDTGASESDISSIIDNQTNPDIYGLLPNNIWESALEGNDQLRRKLLDADNDFGYQDIDNISRLLLAGADPNGLLDVSFLKNLPNLDRLEASAVDDYYTQIANLTNIKDKDGVSVTIPQHVLSELVRCNAPQDLYHVLQVLYGEDVSRSSTAIVALMQDGNHSGSVMLLDREKQTALESLDSQGLGDLLARYAAVYKEATKEMTDQGDVEYLNFDAIYKNILINYLIADTNAMAGRYSTLQQLEANGVFDMIHPNGVFGNRGAGYLMGFLDAVDPVKASEQFVTVNRAGLGELLARNNDQRHYLLDYILADTDAMEERFSTLQKLEARGLLDITSQDGVYGGAGYYFLKNCLESGDPLLASEQFIAANKKGLGELLSKYVDHRGLIANYILADTNAMEERLDFLQKLDTQRLLTIMSPNGPLGSMGQRFLRLCLNSDNPVEIAEQVKNITDGGSTSLWWLNYQYSQLLLGEVNNGAVSEYVVSEIPTALPVKDRDTKLPEDSQSLRKFAEMSLDEKRLYLTDQAIEQGFDSASEVPFNRLSDDTKATLLANRLFTAIAQSRDPAQIERATKRNIALMEQGGPFRLGDIVHGLRDVRSLRGILLSGNMCGEAVGLSSSKDAYPYNVDTVAMSEGVMKMNSFRERLDALGNGGKAGFGRFESVQIVMHRDELSFDAGKLAQGGMHPDHRLIFGAIPSTEISSIILSDAELDIAYDVIDAVIDHGMYIPVYDADGALFLTPEDYAHRREDGNYTKVTPEVVDSSFKLEGTQGGSNEGAWYLVASTRGLERWYVKYGDESEQKAKHLWTEVLADRIYGEVTPAIVSSTKAVVIDGRLARASKEIAIEKEQAVTDAARNEGFIMDCLLGNWDAVYNSKNLVMSQDGHAIRIDTGNALDFRARGEQKDAAAFSDIVVEVEFGTDAENLGGGMRQKYPGLTDEDVRQQVTALRDNLPPEKITELVNSIRRPKAERDHLERTLIARRQYLIDRFLSNS